MLTFMLTSVIQCIAAWQYQCERISHNKDNIARIVNTCLYFVMTTVPYLLYVLTRLYLNTTYTVSSTKNGLKNNQ